MAIGLPRATIDQAAAADTVILLSGDLREELPILFLRLRSAVVDGHLQLVELSPQATSLTPYAAVSLRYGPGDAAAPGPSPGRSEGLRSGGGRSGGPGRGPAAGRDRQRGGHRRAPSLAEDGALVAEAAQVLAGALPAARFLPGFVAAMCTGPWTWAWRRASCPVG